MFYMEEFSNPNEASNFIMEVSGFRIINTPDSQVSPVLGIRPFTMFPGISREATISMAIEPSAARNGTTIYRASGPSGWYFVALNTQIINGKAVARTNQGGIFVVAAGLEIDMPTTDQGGGDVFVLATGVSVGVFVGVIIAVIAFISILAVVVVILICFVASRKSIKKRFVVRFTNFAKQANVKTEEQ